MKSESAPKCIGFSIAPENDSVPEDAGALPSLLGKDAAQRIRDDSSWYTPSEAKLTKVSDG